MNPSNISAIAGSNALPPDVAEARKIRINQDLIDCFQRKVGAKPPSAKGIGLYTHVEGYARATIYPREGAVPRTGDPEYLPIGGPMEIGREGGLEMETSVEVKKLWAEVNSLVKREEALAPVGTSAEKLNERYQALGVPDSKSHGQQSSVGETEIMMGGTKERPGHLKKKKSVSFSLETDTRQSPLGSRTSSGGSRGTGDVVMGGTTESTADTGNTYEASRDPRRRHLYGE